jgi:hypothetical protein
MEAENKKYLIYGGVAFLVGSLGYFIYSTLKNKNPNIAQNVTRVTPEEEEITPKTNPFTDILNNSEIPEIEWNWMDELFSKPLTSKSVLL